jgi:hypothetical protein
VEDVEALRWEVLMQERGWNDFSTAFPELPPEHATKAIKALSATADLVAEYKGWIARMRMAGFAMGFYEWWLASRLARQTGMTPGFCTHANPEPPFDGDVVT